MKSSIFSVVFCIVNVARADTSGFPSLEQLDNNELPREMVGEPVRQWLFPAIRFTCDGYVTKWIFRATNETIAGGIDNSDRPLFLPLMETWEELTESMIGPSIDYRLKSTTGSEQELQGSGPVYEYVLQSPVEVQENDTFGIKTLFPGDTDGAWRLRLETWAVAAGLSYYKTFSGLTFDTDFNRIPNNSIPLVTAVISIPGDGGLTSFVFSQPTPTPAPVPNGNQISTTMAVPPPTSSPSGSISAATSSRMSLSATPPSQMTVQASGTAPGPVQTPTTPQPTEKNPTTPPSNTAIIAGSVAAILSVTFISCMTLVVIIILVMKHRKQCKVYGPKSKESATYTQDPLHNPMYQGVVSGDRNEAQTTRSSSSTGSYHIYAIPGQIRLETLTTRTTEHRCEVTDATSSTLDPCNELESSSHQYDQPSTSTNTVSQNEVPVPSQKCTSSRNNDVYMAPAKDEQSLYGQFNKLKINQIPRDAIILTDHLGSGQFGTVSKGEWQSPEGPVEVAVKMLKEGTGPSRQTDTDRVKFLQEAAIMGQFNHLSVVTLHGVVISGEPKMMVLELLSKGDLRNYLVSLRPQDSNEVDEELPHTLLSYCRQIASGMSYFAIRGFIHRDLAARNVLVSEDGMCKIADFGMSRDLMDENYYTAHGGKVPVKWTAPEALYFKKYSSASDVWSFEILMYEIWSLGHNPFEGYSNTQTVRMIESGIRLAPPPGCPRAIYDIMIKCWHPKSSERPDFIAIVQSLSCSDMKLLKWSEEDKGVHPEVSRLGAGLEVAVELYKDLQNTYSQQ